MNERIKQFGRSISFIRKSYHFFKYDLLNIVKYSLYLVKLFFKTRQIKEHQAKVGDLIIFGDKLHKVPARIAYGEERTKYLIEKNFEVIKKYISKDPIIIDIGANIGIHVLQYSTIPNSFTYAIEPLKINYDLLIKNINYNNIKNVKCFKLGLSNHKGKAFIGSPTKEQGWRYKRWDRKDTALSSIYAKKLVKNNKIVNGEYCEINTLDNFIKINNIKKVSLIKIDTEGHDLIVLKSGIKTIKKHLPIIQLEAVDSILQLGGKTVDDIIEFIYKELFSLYKTYYLNLDGFEEINEQDILNKLYPRGMDLILVPVIKII